jgi:MFS superfamily sulfate permease-like transporter
MLIPDERGPVRTSGRWGTDALAGVTLALLAVPEVLGYTRIAGMPGHTVVRCRLADPPPAG